MGVKRFILEVCDVIRGLWGRQRRIESMLFGYEGKRRE